MLEPSGTIVPVTALGTFRKFAGFPILLLAQAPDRTDMAIAAG